MFANFLSKKTVQCISYKNSEKFPDQIPEKKFLDVREKQQMAKHCIMWTKNFKECKYVNFSLLLILILKHTTPQDLSIFRWLGFYFVM
jgi:hypothetical protein